jgi:hypothetical protein
VPPPGALRDVWLSWYASLRSRPPRTPHDQNKGQTASFQGAWRKRKDRIYCSGWGQAQKSRVAAKPRLGKPKE